MPFALGLQIEKFTVLFGKEIYLNSPAFPTVYLCPQVFNKILKSPLSTLHKQGHIAEAHLDELYLLGQTCEKCVNNVIATNVSFDT